MTQARMFLMGTLLLALAACSNQKDNGLSTDSGVQTQGDGIIGGVAVPEDNAIAKSTVAVYDSSIGALCTGSLLPNNIVVTAAHCIPNDPTSLIIVFTTDLPAAKAQGLKVQARKVDRAQVSPYWAANQDLEKNTGDIALAHFTGAIPAGYVPATLLADRSLLQKGLQVVLAGYGITNAATQAGAFTLRSTFVAVDDASFSASEVSLDQTHGQGACHGDSGGPAYIYNKTSNSYLLWGVTSRGTDDPKDSCGTTAVYTNVLAYANWIQQTSTKLTTPARSLPSRLFASFR